MKRPASLDAFGVISWKLADFSFLALVLYGVLATVNTFAPVYQVSQFTFASTALQALALYGVAGTALLAAAFQILPRLAPTCAMCALVARVQSALVRGGIAVFVISMLVAGLQQGLALANPEVAFAGVTAASKMSFRLSTLGDLSLMLGGLVFLTYVTVSLYRALRVEYAACEWCNTNAKPVEVAS
jgi:cbb3-type cytochrome oxidase subunit 1